LEKTYDFPVFGTNGGGLVKQQGNSDTYIFVEAPDPSTGLTIGDTMPVEWGLAPANQAARALMNRSQGLDEPY
jgi:hypothetical protein